MYCSVTEVPVPNQESERSLYLCVRSIEFCIYIYYINIEVKVINHRSLPS